MHKMTLWLATVDTKRVYRQMTFTPLPYHTVPSMAGGWMDLEGKRGSDSVLCETALSRHGTTRRNLGVRGPCDESEGRAFPLLFLLGSFGH